MAGWLRRLAPSDGMRGRLAIQARRIGGWARYAGRLARLVLFDGLIGGLAMLAARLGRLALVSGRLRRLAMLGGLVVLSGAALLGLLIAASPEPPISRKYEARTAIQRATDGGAATLAAASYQAAQDAFAAGARDLNFQGLRLPWTRSYGRAEARFEAAVRRAELAEAVARRQLDDARDLARRLLAQAEHGFDQMAWVAAYVPPRSAIHSDIRRAQVSYAEARTLLARGEVARAAASARAANVGIDRAYTRFSRFIQSSADPARTAQYERWVRDTISWSAGNNSRAIIVDKMRRTLSLIVDGRRERVYRAELGVNGTLDKVVSGDRATPEGMYRITQKRGYRQTRWYKALLLNYPNEDDLRQFEQARRRGQVSRRARPGGLIEIHGEGGRGGDWTDGCVALNNRDIDDLFDRVSVGTPVTIVGFESGGWTGLPSPSRRTASRRGAAARVSAGAGGSQ